jgi:hypothetical protein
MHIAYQSEEPRIPFKSRLFLLAPPAKLTKWGKIFSSYVVEMEDLCQMVGFAKEREPALG